MNRIRSIIVDDELEAREGIQLLLKDDEDIDVIGLCKNGIEAIDMINDHQIDLAFLDIQMPVINGFEVVNSISKERLPHIIFITAYDQFALQAFEIHAVDYILKPFTDARFYDSLERAKQLINQKKIQEENERLKSVADQLSNQDMSHDPSVLLSETGKRLIIKEKGKIIFVPYKDIIWLEAYDYYIKIHVANTFYLVRESMKNMENKLSSDQFLRIHKSTIINRGCIQEITSGKNAEYYIKLNDQTELKVSRSYRDSVRKMKQEY